MARPKTSDDERRSEFLVLRLTPAERLALIAEAERLSMTLTELARQRITRGRVVVREHRQLDPRQVFELGKIGVNLNQIARALNARQNINPATIEAAIGELNELIAVILQPGDGLPNSGEGGADARAGDDVGATLPDATARESDAGTGDDITGPERPAGRGGRAHRARPGGSG
jgi:hypothetical protein